MSQVFSSQPYRGTRDFYPELLQKRNYIFSTWRNTLNKLGYQEYETSLLENAELYIAKSGAELGNSQLYNFKDKGDRFIALRPEQTPSLARLVANKFGELKFPLRWFSIPNCFRYERPQKGRLREHWQLNVDIIGLPAGEAELELLFILGELFKSFGANKKHFKVMYNHRKVLDTWLLENDLDKQSAEIYKVLDDWFKISLEENQKQLKEAGLSDDKIQLITDLTQKKSKAWEQYQSIADNFTELKLLRELLPKIQPDLEYDFNPCIIRGIAYYTGLVLEAFDKNPDNSRALFGGGRYDDLMELFGKSTSAVGFGFGDVTMNEFLEGWGLYPDFQSDLSKVGIIPFDNNSLTEIFNTIIPRLISENKIFEINYEFDRSENKRYQALKKRDCQDIIKIGFN
jgi:histidyl-tRNA synthetase